MESELGPRVNFETMQRFVGRRVSIVGEIESTSEGELQILTSDGARVTVKTNPRAPYESKFVEITGTVIDPKTIQEEDHHNFGENYDLKLYNELVKLSTGKYAELFSA